VRRDGAGIVVDRDLVRGDTSQVISLKVIIEIRFPVALDVMRRSNRFMLAREISRSVLADRRQPDRRARDASMHCILNLALDAKKSGSEFHETGATAAGHPPRQKESKKPFEKHSRTGTYLISENDRNCQQLRRILPGNDRSGIGTLPPKFDCLLKTKPFIKRCPERR
jgi:hypothetical protein